MLQGIDVASYQGDINIGAVPSDFVIIKATGGNGYVNPWCDPIMQKTIAAGKRKGVYHFRDDGFGDSGAITEANYFVDNIQGYLDGKTLLVLDWEAGNLGDVAWAKAWLDHVFARTGVKPLIYMSESVVNAYDWMPVVRADYGLWVAKYGQNTGNPGTEPNISDWPFYIMWQYTSRKRLPGYGGDLDHNIFEGTGDVWDAYCRNTKQAPVVIPQPPVVVNDPVKPVPVHPAPTPQPELPPEAPSVPSEPSKPETGTPTPSEPETPQNGSKSDNFWTPLLDIARTRKFWVSVAGGLVTFLTAVYGSPDWLTGLTALLTSIGVYVAPNKQSK